MVTAFPVRYCFWKNTLPYAWRQQQTLRYFEATHMRWRLTLNLTLAFDFLPMNGKSHSAVFLPSCRTADSRGLAPHRDLLDAAFEASFAIQPPMQSPRNIKSLISIVAMKSCQRSDSDPSRSHAGEL